MREIRDGSKSSSVERIAVMAALNLAHDFSASARAAGARRAGGGAPTALTSPPLRRRIAGMQSAIDQVLRGHRTSCSDATRRGTCSTMFPAVFELSIHSLNQC